MPPKNFQGTQIYEILIIKIKFLGKLGKKPVCDIHMVDGTLT